jgi:NADH-ubiquinone oxidoreductase chain 5
MYLTLIFLPLKASLLANNRFCGKKGGPILSVFCLKVAACKSLVIFYEVAKKGSPVSIELGNWIDYGNLSIQWNLYYDTLTASKYLPIVIISFLIQVYSLEYMGHDPHKARFFSLLSLFAVTMLILVTGENLLIILLGWEGVGIVSYLLVNFWFTRIAANKASLSALFLNKIGDLFLLIAIILAVGIFSDLSLSTIYSLAHKINSDVLFIFILCIILAASAKSALIGFTPWLAKAMEGPTSVSALLHSSTKVTAGVYLLKRISPLLELSSTALMIVIWLGSLGALFGAMCGLVDNDIKRIIAFSTMSQLGYKVVAAGISQYNIALFHLILHAVFKSLLFLSSGAILHAVLDHQSLLRKGSLNLFLPFTYLVFLFASLSLMAFPFTSGFYSKDFLLELLCVPHHFSHSFAYLFTLLAALITSTYSVRIFMIAMFSRPLFSKSLVPFVIDSPLLMT